MGLSKTPPALGYPAKTGYMSDDGWVDHPSQTDEKKLAHILWRNAKQLVSLLEKEYGFGQREVSKKRQSTPHVLIGKEGGFGPPGLAAEPNLTRTVTCAECGGTFKVKDGRTGSVNEVVYCSNCAKSMHGIGQEKSMEQPIVKLGAKVREKGAEWPVYHLGKNVMAKEIDGKFEYIGSETISMLKELGAQGKLEILEGKSEGALMIHY